MTPEIEFKSKEHFVNFVKKNFNVDLENDKQNVFNQKRKLLYTNLGQNGRNNHLKSFLYKKGFETSEHKNGYFWVKFKK